MQNWKIQQQIISLLRKGNEKGISLLYDHYAAAILGYIDRIIGDKEISEEVLQNVFLNVWQNFSLFNEKKATLFTWMTAIARNAALDKIRLKGFQNPMKTSFYDLSVNETQASRLETASLDAVKLLERLEEQYRIVLELLYLEGFSQQEVADILEIPLGTVKTRARTALVIIRKVLSTERRLFTGWLFSSLNLMFCLS